MSGPGDEAKTREAADEAVRWFVRLQDEDSTGDDWLAFEAWLAASPAHAEAYEQVERAWVDVEVAAPVRASALPEAVVIPLRPPARSAPRISRRAWTLGATAVAAGLAVAVLGPGFWPGAPSETFIAPPGQTRAVVLADGTHVQLNASSRIDVRLGRKAREVQLADGEAVFDVAHDPDRPFLISTGQREVRVVGTKFNLRQRDGEFDLAVARGVVEVRAEGGGAPTRVAAGQRLTAHRNEAGLLEATASDAPFAWTQGLLVYEDAPLSTVADDLGRSLGAPVRAEGDAGRLRFSGVLALDDRAAIPRRLEAFAPVRVESVGAGYVIRAR